MCNFRDDFLLVSCKTARDMLFWRRSNIRPVHQIFNLEHDSRSVFPLLLALALQRRAGSTAANRETLALARYP